MMKRRFTKTTQSYQQPTGNHGKSKEDIKRKEAGKQSRLNPLRCTLCCGELHDPKLLQCYHTFCTKCLKEYVEGKKLCESFPCPLCQVNTNIPSGGISDLPNNLYVMVYDAMNACKNQCHQCESGDGVIARCTDCDENMCMACKNVHQKMRATKGHNVVLLAEQKKIHNASLSKQGHCDNHPESDVSFVCQACNLLICEVCKDDDHHNHKVEDISEVAKKKKEGLSRLVDGVRSYLPYVKNNMEKADKESTKLKSDVNRTKQKITDVAERLKKEIDSMCARKIEEIDVIFNEYLLSVEKFKNEMERLYLSVRTLADMSNQILEIAPNGLFLQTSHEIGQRLESVPTEIPACSLVSARTSFQPNGLLPEDILGEIQVSPLSILKFSPSDKKVPSFHCPGRPYTICPAPDGEAWVICDTPETIQLYSKNGNIRQFLKMPGEVNDMCCSPSGELYVTELRGRAIWKVGADNSVTTLTTVDETVRGICCSNGKFYVTRKDGNNHLVSILTQESGDIETDISQNGGIPFFCHPDRVAVTSTGTICVTDRGQNGAVVFVTHDGHLQSSYKGQGAEDHEPKSRFEPWGLCIDKDDNVFISDRFNDAIHLLKQNGVFQKFLLTQDDGIKRPLGIAADGGGHIWVGNEDGSIRVFDYNELLS